MGGGGGGTIQEFNASALASNVARQQWQDYQNRFVPYQKKIVESVNSPQMQTDLEGFARNAVSNAFNTQWGAQKRDLARLGTVMTGRQAQDAANQLGLAQSGQAVAGLNMARQHTKDANLAAMAGGMGASRSFATANGGQ